MVKNPLKDHCHILKELWNPPGGHLSFFKDSSGTLIDKLKITYGKSVRILGPQCQEPLGPLEGSLEPSQELRLLEDFWNLPKASSQGFHGTKPTATPQAAFTFLRILKPPTRP